MTIANSTNKSGPYFYNGSATTFAYGFKIDDATHIRVVETVIATGVETDLVLNSAYTVTGVGADTGNVVITPARAAGKTVTLVRKVPFTQTTVLENQGAYFAKVVEGALDRSVARDQQLQEQIDRAIKVSVSSDLSPDDLIADLTAGSAAAVAAAILTAADAAATAADRVQTGADRTQTGLDRVATAAGAVATAADRVQTGADRTAVATNKGLVDTAKAAVDVARAATDANVVLTAADVVSAEADRVATAADAVATAADRVQTGLDRTAAAASAASVDLPGSPVALNYLRRNAGNTAYEARTPIQTLADIAASGATMATTADEAAVRKTIGLELGYPLFHVVDEKPNGTGGGAASAGYNIRAPNTVRTNSISGASLSAGLVTLPAGTYWIEVEAISYGANRNRLSLVDNAAPTTQIYLYGTDAFGASSPATGSLATLQGRVVLATAKTLQIRHWIQTVISSRDLGCETSATGLPEVYVDFKAWALK